MKKILLFIISLSILFVQAQDFASPSLTLGVGKVLYDKGSLDASLIAEIIATKQDEVKKELMKRWVQNNIDGGSLVVQNFIKQNLDILLTESSPDVIRKELLHNAAELALVVGIAEFYMQDLRRRCQMITDFSLPYPSSGVSSDEINFVLEYGRKLDPETRVTFLKDFFSNSAANFVSGINVVISDFKTVKRSQRSTSTSPRSNNEERYYRGLHLEEKIAQSLLRYDLEGFSIRHPLGHMDRQNFIQRLIPDRYIPCRKKLANISALNSITSAPPPALHNFLSKPEILVLYKNTDNYVSERDAKEISPNHVLIDLVYDVCIKNSRLRDIGFFQRVDLSAGQFKNQNKFTSVPDSQIHKWFSPIEAEIKKTIDIVFSTYQLMINPSLITSTVLATPMATYQSRITSTLSQLNIDIQNIRVQSNAMAKEEQDFFAQILQLRTVNFSGQILASNYSDFARFLTSTLPQLQSSNVKYNSAFTGVIATLESLKLIFEEAVVNAIGNDAGIMGERVGDSATLNRLIAQYSIYKLLAETVSKLDQIESYDKIIKFLGDLGNIYSNQGVGRIIDSFVNAYDKYVTFVKEDNKLKIDVQGIATDLFDRYGKNNKTNFGMYFTVGVNQYFQKLPTKSEKTTNTNSQDSVNGISFVSEKIGLRYSLVNYSKKRALMKYGNKKIQRLDNNQQPIVSNIHIIPYASGLLYQIEALKSSKKFNYSIGGISIGVSFFNGLDFNLGMAAQFGDITNRFYAAGFDINFTEYLSALKKKKSN